jgi:carbamoyl-phosphate synthase small subunit
MKIFPFDATYDDLASFSPDGFLVKWPRCPEPLLGAIQVAKKSLIIISHYLEFV